jgi:hypothetical protein
VFEQFTVPHMLDIQVDISFFYFFVDFDTGRDDVEPFLKARKLPFSWESVRNKVMNERVKWQRLLKKRADSFM